MFGGKKETGSGLQNQIGERDQLLKEQREWMKEFQCGKCRCGWEKNICKVMLVKETQTCREVGGVRVFFPSALGKGKAGRKWIKAKLLHC